MNRRGQTAEGEETVNVWIWVIFIILALLATAWLIRTLTS